MKRENDVFVARDYISFSLTRTSQSLSVCPTCERELERNGRKSEERGCRSARKAKREIRKLRKGEKDKDLFNSRLTSVSA